MPPMLTICQLFYVGSGLVFVPGGKFMVCLKLWPIHVVGGQTSVSWPFTRGPLVSDWKVWWNPESQLKWSIIFDSVIVNGGKKNPVFWLILDFVFILIFDNPIRASWGLVGLSLPTTENSSACACPLILLRRNENNKKGRLIHIALFDLSQVLQVCSSCATIEHSTLYHTVLILC